MKHFFIFIILTSILSSCAQTPKEILSTNENKGQWLQDDEKVEDAPNHKAVNGFGAHLIVVKNPDDFIKKWLKPEKPNFFTAEKVKSGEKIGIIVLFAGCRPDNAGVCNTVVDYNIKRPDGTEVFEQKNLELWKETAPPKANTHLGKAIIKLEMLKTNPMGQYKVKAKVYDKNADVSFELETQFTLINE